MTCTMVVLEQPSTSAIVGQNTIARARLTGRGLDFLPVQNDDYPSRAGEA